MEKELASRPPKPEPKAPQSTAQSKKKHGKISLLEQWVEIETSESGETVTTLYPSNEVLMQKGQKLSPAPEMVYRRLNFIGPVPEAYAWTTDESSTRASGGMGIQRMSMEMWLAAIKKEKELGTGHLLPCGGNLPRPEERGGCECPTCSTNRRILDARSAT